MSLVWCDFIYSLRRAHVRLSDCKDELIWDLDPTGGYYPKVVYIFIIVEHFNRI